MNWKTCRRKSEVLTTVGIEKMISGTWCSTATCCLLRQGKSWMQQLPVRISSYVPHLHNATAHKTVILLWDEVAIAYSSTCLEKLRKTTKHTRISSTLLAIPISRPLLYILDCTRTLICQWLLRNAHGSDYKDDCHMECDDIYCARQVPNYTVLCPRRQHCTAASH
jgi:hypothetical protein